MKRQHWIWVMIVAVAVSAPLVAGPDKKCSADTQVCLNKMAAKLKSRGWVGVEMDHNEKGQQVVASVMPESPAEKAGVQVGDVLLAVNGVDYDWEANGEKLEKMYAKMLVGKTVTYTVARGGCCHKGSAETAVKVTLGELPDTVLAQWVGNHMLQHAAIEMAHR